MYQYKCKGTCSQQINFEMEDGIVKSCQFIGGCNGNTKGISQLVVGMKAEKIIERLKGTTCGYKDTSCPDQFARALELALEKENSKA